jgi:uncharacterized protein (TIGR00251 family)
VIDYSIRENRIVFNVKVIPRASRSEIAGEQEGVLRVKIAAPPVDGAANEELMRVLAKHFRIRSGAVRILAGQNGRMKRISIEGISPEDLQTIGR